MILSAMAITPVIIEMVIKIMIKRLRKVKKDK